VARFALEARVEDSMPQYSGSGAAISMRRRLNTAAAAVASALDKSLILVRHEFSRY
jgi:hypothetical protein